MNKYIHERYENTLGHTQGYHERPEYVYNYPDDPNAPTQNEDGLLESAE
jgi:hypothetical protein